MKNGVVVKNGWVSEVKDGCIYWYYAENGILATSWRNIDGAWYHFNFSPDVGIGTPFMCTGLWIIYGTWYYFDDESGATVTNGWIPQTWDDGYTEWYYANEDGSLLTGWQQIGGKWYFFNTWYYDEESGYFIPPYMFSDGTFTIDGKDETFDANGAWVEDGGSSYASSWAQEGGSWSYYKGGSKATGWQAIDGVWYYFDASGAMAADAIVDGYYVDANGAMVSNSWIQKGGAWYYFGGDGAMLTGWQTIDGVWYYFYADGTMAANTTIDGYTIDGSGAWVA